MNKVTKVISATLATTIVFVSLATGASARPLGHRDHRDNVAPGIAAGIAAVTLSGDERGTLAREARRFAGAVEYAADRARVRHETIGVSASGEAWRFWRRTVDGRWSALSDDPALAPRTLPPPLRAVPHSYAGGALRPDAIVPLRASGRNEPFAFILASEHLQAVVSTDPLSRVSVSAAESIPR